MNIFAPSPITRPSDLYSIAGEAIEFANPVIGTTEPAPARFPIASYKSNAVKIIAISIRSIEVIAETVSLGNPRAVKKLVIN